MSITYLIFVVISDVSSIATRFTLSGTFKHAYMNIQPNGNKISWQGVSIIHIQGMTFYNDARDTDLWQMLPDTQARHEDRA